MLTSCAAAKFPMNTWSLSIVDNRDICRDKLMAVRQLHIMSIYIYYAHLDEKSKQRRLSATASPCVCRVCLQELEKYLIL